MCGYQSAGTVDARLEFRARGTSSRYVSGRFLTITVHPTHALCPGKTRFNLEKKLISSNRIDCVIEGRLEISFLFLEGKGKSK